MLIPIAMCVRNDDTSTLATIKPNCLERRRPVVVVVVDAHKENCSKSYERGGEFAQERIRCCSKSRRPLKQFTVAATAAGQRITKAAFVVVVSVVVRRKSCKQLCLPPLI